MGFLLTRNAELVYLVPGWPSFSAISTRLLVWWRYEKMGHHWKKSSRILYCEHQPTLWTMKYPICKRYIRKVQYIYITYFCINTRSRGLMDMKSVPWVEGWWFNTLLPPFFYHAKLTKHRLFSPFFHSKPSSKGTK